MVRTIKRGYSKALPAVAALVLLCVLAGSSIASPGAITRASVDSSGAEAAEGGFVSALSPDGRYVAFVSIASLVPDDTNGGPDVFVRDLQNGTTQRVSVDSFGNQTEYNGSASTGVGGISADGRYVAFSSSAANLVEGDTNGASDVFVRDLQAGTTKRVNVGGLGNQADGESWPGGISADGRYVAFTSSATNLVPGDTNGEPDVFVRDLQAGTTKRANVGGLGNQADGYSSGGSMSANGRYVAFASVASNLVENDTNGSSDDVFVRDLQTGTTRRVSIDSSGTEANSYSVGPSISASGRYVAFSSWASNLVAADQNDQPDVFVHDLQTGTTQRASMFGCRTEGNGMSYPSTAISADGHYVVFNSWASNLVENDTNGSSDIFVRDMQSATTQRISVDSAGNQANSDSNNPAMSADGHYASFDSYATNLVADDTNNQPDVFVRDLQPQATQTNDAIAPTTTACGLSNGGRVGGGTYEPGMWSNTDVQVSFSAQDNEGGSGIGSVRYSATGAQSITETLYDAQKPPIVGAEGTTTLSYFATDNAGNRESPAKTFPVKIDKTPPRVTQTSPSNNATGVAATAKISATFSDRLSGMAPDSLNADNISVVQLNPTGNVPVSGSVSFDETSQKVTFTPAKSLAKGAYRAYLFPGICDKAGNGLTDTYTWTFTTAGPSKR